MATRDRNETTQEEDQEDFSTLREFVGKDDQPEEDKEDPHQGKPKSR